MPFRALVVDPDSGSLSTTREVLAAAGYLVVCESEFEGARRRLAFSAPDLLITSVRLGAYNGLHLVLRAKADNPEMPAIVRDPQRDPVLEQEATKMGAVYVAGPIEFLTLIELAEKLLAESKVRVSSTVERRWPRKTAVAAVPVAVAGEEAKLVDASYGGLRLELSGVPNNRLPQIDAVSIPGVGRIPIHPVWARGGVDAPTVWWCGVEVDADKSKTPAWRAFVDLLN